MDLLKAALLISFIVGSQAFATPKLQVIDVAGDLKVSIPSAAQVADTGAIDSVVKTFRERDREIQIDYGSHAGRLQFFDQVDKFSMRQEVIEGRTATLVKYLDPKTCRYVSAISIPEVRKAECDSTSCNSNTLRRYFLQVSCRTEACQKENETFLTKIEILNQKER